MKRTNEMKLSFLSKSVNEGFARSAVAAFIASLDPTVDALSDIKTAVSEAVTNAVVHGYRDSLGIIYIAVRLYEDGRVEITVKDKGCGIEDVEKAMEPLYTSCDTGERAGLGFAVMQSLMDKVKVRSKPQKGTRVVLTKRISPRDR